MTLKIANREFPATAIGGMKMKKMLAACAAMMVAGLVSADITSDNIVGYTQKTSVSGFNWLAPMFIDVGTSLGDSGTSVSLDSIALSDGGAGGIGWGGEIIQILDDGGAVTTEYYYNDPLNDLSGEQTDYYWGDAAGTPVTASIGAGDSVLLFTASEDIGYTVAGQVPESNITLTSVAGFNFTGNPFPASLPLANIAISDDGAGSIGWGGEIIQILDDGGAVTTEYYYNDPLNDLSGEQTDYYWGDAAGTPVTVSIEAGDGVLLFTASDGLQITITKPYTL